MVRVFGHYFTIPIIALAVIETALWFSIVGTLVEAGMATGALPNFQFGLPVTAVVLAGAVFVLVFSAFGLYNRDVFLDFRIFLQRATTAFAVILALGYGAVVIFRATSLAHAAEYFGLVFVAVLVQMAVCAGLRVLFLSFSDTGFLKRRVLVIGEEKAVNQLRETVFCGPVRHLSLAGTLTPRADQAGDRTLMARLSALLSTGHIDEIVVAERGLAESAVGRFLHERADGVRMTDYQAFLERETGQVDLEALNETADLAQKNVTVLYIRQAAKRALDVLGATGLLLFTLPLTLITAIFIKFESPGGVFYRQERIGMNGRPFVIFKFRSMRNDAEAAGPQWASANDGRVTRVGHIIRKFRIDELPQLLNVLRGEMSLVGPRPERPYFDDQLSKEIPQWRLRHTVKPGVTGWAQVNCGYGCDLEGAKRKLAYDLYYVKHQRLFLDLIILLQTVRVVAMREGAH